MIEQSSRLLKVGLSMLFVILLVVLAFVILWENGFLGKKALNLQPTVTTSQPQPEIVPPPVPEKEFQRVETINFGTSTPPDFPINIPIEKGSKFEQSYATYYPEQKQLTIVFRSTKTVKENYTLYADFLKKENWVISNKNESDGVSFLYGTKGSNDINVTISSDISTISTKSQVSISILEK